MGPPVGAEDAPVGAREDQAGTDRSRGRHDSGVQCRVVGARSERYSITSSSEHSMDVCIGRTGLGKTGDEVFDDTSWRRRGAGDNGVGNN
jgi:hypothetical protein